MNCPHVGPPRASAALAAVASGATVAAPRPINEPVIVNDFKHAMMLIEDCDAPSIVIRREHTPPSDDDFRFNGHMPHVTSTASPSPRSFAALSIVIPSPRTSSSSMTLSLSELAGEQCLDVLQFVPGGERPVDVRLHHRARCPGLRGLTTLQPMPSRPVSLRSPYFVPPGTWHPRSDGRVNMPVRTSRP